jgi:hypothetical protein
VPGPITSADQTFIGTTDPNFLFGFHIDATLQNFTYNMFWQGQEGGLVYNAWKNYQFPGNNTGANFSTALLSAWSPSNPDSRVPAPTLNSVQIPDSYFYESATYLKLRLVQVGYNFPDPLLAKVHVSRLRVFLSGSNLLIIKSKSNTMRDPEVIPGSSFPIPKTYSLGFNGSF